MIDVPDFLMTIKKEVVDKDAIFKPQQSPMDLLFDSIQMPPWQSLLTMGDLGTLHWITTSKSLAGNAQKRQEYLNQVMEKRGFKFMAGGTNRNVYRHYEVPHIVAKVPIDRVGMNDNVCEFKNQFKIWPYCAKTIQITPDGIVGFAERLNPIVNRIQFEAYATMIYMTSIEIIGKYVLEDIGEKYFKNWGVRKGMGCALVDYPYIFELDGSKLICKNMLPDGSICFGEIDYDAGFNELHCKRCGHYYHASDLQLFLNQEKIQVNKKKGGRKPMKVQFMRGGEVLSGDYASDSIVRPSRAMPKAPGSTDMKVSFNRGGVVVASSEMDVYDHPEPVAAEPGKEKVSYSLTVDMSPTPAEPINLFDTSPGDTEEDLAKKAQDAITPEVLGDPRYAEAYRKAMAGVGGLEVVSGGQDENGVFMDLANGDHIRVPWDELWNAIGKDMVDQLAKAVVDSQSGSQEVGPIVPAPEEPKEEEPKEGLPDLARFNPTPTGGLNIPQTTIDAVNSYMDDYKDEKKGEEKKDGDEFPPNQWGPGSEMDRPVRRRVMTDSASSQEVKRQV